MSRVPVLAGPEPLSAEFYEQQECGEGREESVGGVLAHGPSFKTGWENLGTVGAVKHSGREESTDLIEKFMPSVRLHRPDPSGCGSTERLGRRRLYRGERTSVLAGGDAGKQVSFDIWGRLNLLF